MDHNFANAVNTWHDKLTNSPVAEAHGLAYTPLEDALRGTAAAGRH
jgi:hypothetical protein